MKFVHPSNILVSGPTKSGKSVLIAQLIVTKHFEPPPDVIVWVYNEWQSLYSELHSFLPNVHFIAGGSESILDQLYTYFQPNVNNMLVLDDQMEECANSKILSKFFTQGSHHRNLTVIYFVQNLFEKGNSHRNASLNAQYIILMKNARDEQQMHTLARQMLPNKWRSFVSIYEEATEKPYHYLLIDFNQDTPNNLRIQTKVLPNQYTTVYIPL